MDRFHVAQAYRDCADTVRKHEVRRLKQELPKEEYEEIKGAMWPFRKAVDKLKREEKELLARLFAYSPKLKRAHTLREELTKTLNGTIRSQVPSVHFEPGVSA